MGKSARNAPCFCGSGKKYKNCCLHKKNEIALQEKAALLINEGRFAEAEKLLTDALKEFDDVVLRNNLAVILLEQGKPGLCLDVLEVCLEPTRIDMAANPFTYALAARALALLGERDNAYKYLKYAEDSFAEGLNVFRKAKMTEGELHSWKEYSVAIMKAAAELGDNKRVLEIYNRFKNDHVGWECIFLAAAASFNLKDYEGSAAFWEESSRRFEFMLRFKQVTELVQDGTIPHFVMGKKMKSWDEMMKIMTRISQDPQALAEEMEDGVFLMFMLTMIFDPQIEDKASIELTEKLVCQGLAWGEEFGKRLLRAPQIAQHIKMAAARGLKDTGVYRADEPVPIIVDGEEKKVKLLTLSVTDEADEETYEAMCKAQQLQEEGRLEDAARTLQDLLLNKSIFFPPLVINLSNLLYQLEKYEEAETFLRMVEEIDPEDGVVHYNLALVLINLGSFEEAGDYLQRIIEHNEEPELRERAESLREELLLISNEDLLEQFSTVLAAYEEKRREKIEEKPISPTANLARCLKNMPAEWLTGLCRSLEIEPVSRRGEREQQCRQGLLEKDRLRRLLKDNIKGNERALLHYLLKHGGWARLSVVSRKYGKMEGDGFYWEAEPPVSPTGVLWSLGLVMVGKAKLEKRQEKIVMVPMELREPLAELL